MFQILQHLFTTRSLLTEIDELKAKLKAKQEELDSYKESAKKELDAYKEKTEADAEECKKKIEQYQKQNDELKKKNRALNNHQANARPNGNGGPTGWMGN